MKGSWSPRYDYLILRHRHPYFSDSVGLGSQHLSSALNPLLASGDYFNHTFRTRYPRCTYPCMIVTFTGERVNVFHICIPIITHERKGSQKHVNMLNNSILGGKHCEVNETRSHAGGWFERQYYTADKSKRIGQCQSLAGAGKLHRPCR